MGVYHQAGLYPNPQVGYFNATASSPRSGSNWRVCESGIVTANRFGLAQQCANQEINRFQWDNEAQRMRVLNDLRIRYYEVLGAQEVRTVAQNMVDIAERGMTMVQQKVEAKQGSHIDYLQAKIQLESIRLTRDEADQRYVAAWEQLATIAGLPPMNPVPLDGVLSSEVPELNLDDRWQYLLSSSPQLRSNEFDLGHA